MTPIAPKALSNREFEIFLAVCEGKSNKVIADQFCVVEKTIKFHLTNIYRKLGCKSRHEMTARFYKSELPAELVKQISTFASTTKGFVEGSTKPSPDAVTSSPESGLPRGKDL